MTYSDPCRSGIEPDDPTRTIDHLKPRSRTWGADIMLQHDGTSLEGPDNGGIHIATEWPSHIGLVVVILLSQLLHQRPHTEIITGHGDQVVHLIAVVDVHHLGQRCQTVLRVEIPVPADIFIKSPWPVTEPTKFIKVPARLDIGDPVVDIVELPMDQISEAILAVNVEVG